MTCFPGRRKIKEKEETNLFPHNMKKREREGKLNQIFKYTYTPASPTEFLLFLWPNV